MCGTDLGARTFFKKDGDSIIKHRFYRDVPFEEIINGDVKAPWQPELKSQRDTAFFEKYPESQESARRLSTELDDHLFIDF